MKGQRIFPSIILIGFGLFFFLEQTSPSFSIAIFSWPTILLVIGLAFLVQAYAGKTYDSILPAVLFIGLGVHFHLVQHWNIQFVLIGVVTLFLSLGYFLLNQKSKGSLFFAWLFLILAFIQLFYNEILEWFGIIETKLGSLVSLLPIIFILLGCYVLFFKRK